MKYKLKTVVLYPDKEKSNGYGYYTKSNNYFYDFYIWEVSTNSYKMQSCNYVFNDITELFTTLYLLVRYKWYKRKSITIPIR